MKLLVVNPNTTASMTDKIAAAASAVAGDGAVVTAVQPAAGPVSIEGYYDEAFAVPGLIDEVRRHPDADAIVVACFDDTGVDAARCITAAPVIGIGEAAYHLAAMVSAKFAVVTTLPRSVAALEHNLTKYGLAARCAKVRAADVPVLALEDDDDDARARISDEIKKAIADDRADAIVLGCAGMTDLAADLAAAHQVPVIDGVAAAVKLAEALVAVGATTSKAGAYAAPRPKPYHGAMSPWSP